MSYSFGHSPGGFRLNKTPFDIDSAIGQSPLSAGVCFWPNADIPLPTRWPSSVR